MELTCRNKVIELKKKEQALEEERRKQREEEMKKDYERKLQEVAEKEKKEREKKIKEIKDDYEKERKISKTEHEKEKIKLENLVKEEQKKREEFQNRVKHPTTLADAREGGQLGDTVYLYCEDNKPHQFIVGKTNSELKVSVRGRGELFTKEKQMKY
jgi:hypothetical protein